MISYIINKATSVAYQVVPSINEIYNLSEKISLMQYHEVSSLKDILQTELVIEYLPSFIVLLSCEDEVTKGLRKVLLRTEKIHLWIIVDLQIALDIHKIMS